MKKNLLSFICLLPLITVASELPDIGDSSYHALTPTEERELGEVFFREAKRSKRIMFDAFTGDYINRLGNNLLKAAGENEDDFHFFVVRNSQINAFAGPGGYIGVHSGLILITRSESELAAAVAHEIAHVTQRHIAQSFEKAERQRWISLATLIAAAAMSTQNATLGTGTITASLAGMSQQFVNFTRQNEQEADRVGIRLLAKAGFNTKSMPEFFEHMQQVKRLSQAFVPEILSTHPVSTTRIADALHRANDYPTGKSNIDPMYPFAVERIRVIASEDNEKILSHYASRKNMTDAEKYGFALAQLKSHRLERAENVIMALMKNDPDNTIYPFTLAEIAHDADNTKHAAEILEPLLKKHPDFYPANSLYAKTLLQGDENKKAKRFLLSMSRKHPKNADYLWLLGKAYGKMGNIAKAYEARAKALILINENNRAKEQLTIALKSPDLDKYTKARIEARLGAL